MKPGSGANAVGVAVCVILLTSALGLTASEQRGSRGSEASLGGKSRATQVSGVPQVSSRLAPGMHPAADPVFGALWTLSHRLIMPVAGVEPGELRDTFAQLRAAGRRHEAIDIGAPRESPVVAVTDGVVLRLTEHDSGGITLYLLAPDGRTLFYYAHLARYADGVHGGLAVRQGAVIGYVGDTGNAGAGNYHLHFEVMHTTDPQGYWAARPLNPYPLLKRARG